MISFSQSPERRVAHGRLMSERWRQCIGQVSQTAKDGELREAYKQTVISMYEAWDPHFAERLVSESFELIDSLMSTHPPWSFAAFCRSVRSPEMY